MTTFFIGLGIFVAVVVGSCIGTVLGIAACEGIWILAQRFSKPPVPVALKVPDEGK